MKKILFFLALIMMLSVSDTLLSQSVTFKMKRPPINQLRAADLWSATIINGGEPFTAYLYGSMTNNENGELIATGQTMTFEVKKGTTNFKISDLPRNPDVNYISKDEKYKKSFMNTGNAPSGDYKICVELRKTDNSVTGEDCFDQKIMGSDAPQLISPRNEEELRIDNPVFTWMHMKGPGSTVTYKLKIVEIKGNESPENAMLKNKAFFEKEGITSQLFQYPVSAPKFEEGKKYAWQISTGDVTSEVNIFDRWGNILTSTITLTSPSNRITIESDSISFSWKISNPSDSAFGSSIKIVELKGDESPENAMLKNKAFFEKEGIMATSYSYPPPDRKFENGKTYAWQVKTGNVVSPVGVFLRGGFIIPLIALVGPVNGIKVDSDSISFRWTISNPSDSVMGARIKIVEIKGNESPDNAIAKNKAFFEKEGIRGMSFSSPPPDFEGGKEYAWQVSIGNVFSNIGTFTQTAGTTNNTGTLTLISPANGTSVESDSITFIWRRQPPPKNGFTLRIVELAGNESPANAIAKNKAFFEKEGIREQLYVYDGPRFENGKKYVWGVGTTPIVGDWDGDGYVFLRGEPIVNNGTINDKATINNAGTWNGTVTNNGGTIIMTGTSNTGGTISITGTLPNTGTFASGTVITGGTLQTNNGPLTVTGGTINDGSFTLTTLSGTNTYSGSTTVNAGTLQTSSGTVTATGGAINSGVMPPGDSLMPQKVTFHMKRPPLNQLKISDLLEVEITNYGDPFTGNIAGSLRNVDNGSLVGDFTSTNFEVKKGTYKLGDLTGGKLPDINYISKDTKYRTFSTGNAPEGNYEVCIELRYKDTKTTVKDCFDQKITDSK